MALPWPSCGADDPFCTCPKCDPPSPTPGPERRHLHPLDHLETAAGEIVAKGNALRDQLTKNVSYPPSGVRRLARVRARLAGVIAQLEEIEKRNGEGRMPPRAPVYEAPAVVDEGDAFSELIP